MKRLLIIGCLMILSWSLPAQDLDSLYQVFEKNKGEVAYQAAVAIDETIGREPNFTLETDKDEIKLKILRTMILYFFGNDDFQRVITYSEIGVEHYDKIEDYFNEAGCYMTLANAYQRLGQLDKAIECYNRRALSWFSLKVAPSMTTTSLSSGTVIWCFSASKVLPRCK